MKKLKDLSDIEKSEILNQRKLGTTEKEISSKFDISLRQYYNLLKLNNIEKKSKVVKYNFDENYFESIDTEDKAYFLGFIVADGCISDKTNTIKIIQKEIDILYEFKKYINSDGGIFTSKNRNISSFSVSSAKTKNDLQKLGIHSNKTMVVKYPSIPDNLQNHFMRGVFDGDGCITLRTDKRDNQQRGQVNICSGSYDFIKDYYDKLVLFANLSGRNKIRCPKGTYHVVDWGGLSDVENIYNFLYKDSTIYLNRKKETFEKVISITKDKNKYRK
jgi:hypothetical protein